MTRLVVGAIYLVTVIYCVLWGLVFLRNPLLPFTTPDIDVNLLLRSGKVGAAVLLGIGFISGNRARDPMLQSHLVWLGVSVIVAVVLSIMGLGFLFLGAWLQWEWAAYTAMGIWALAGAWLVVRLLWGGVRFLTGRSVSRWPLRSTPAA